MEQFTMAVALEYQKRDIEKYRGVLNKKCFVLLKQHAELRNATTTNPYDVFRGQDVHIWIELYALRKQDRKAGK